MSFQQVGDILRIVEDALQSMRVAARNRVSHPDAGRSPPGHREPLGEPALSPEELLLQRLDQEHRRLHRLIHSLGAAPQHQLAVRTWIQYVPIDDLKPAVARVVDARPAPFEAQVDALGDFYGQLRHFLQRIREQTMSVESSQLLDELLCQVEYGARLLASSLNGIRDM
jgi:hypothetical protein